MISDLTTVEELYGEIWPNEDAELEAALGESLAPRSLEALYDAFAALRIGEHALVLDAGCRDARHAIELVRRLGCRVFALDPIGHHEALEARRLFAVAALLAESMDPARFEHTAERAGFDLVSRDDLDSEWREHMVEQGTWDPARDLLRIARLRRREDELVERHGRARYEATRADALWGIYQLLGKLRPTIWALERRCDG